MRLLCLLPALLLAGCAAAPYADHHQHLIRAELMGVVMPASRMPPIEGDQLVRMLDEAGIRRATVLGMGYSYAAATRNLPDEYERVRAENDWTAAQAAKYPERLVAFCGVNPLKDYAVHEIARCANAGRMRGVKLHFGNSDVQLENEEHAARVQAVFAAANAHRMAIVVHARASVSRKRPYGAAQARVFLEKLLPAAPDVVVQVAHLAATGPGYDDPAGRDALGVYIDAIARNDPRVRNLWLDASGLLHAKLPGSEAALLAADIRRVGVGRVLFGSDAAVPPNFTPREAWAAFSQVPLTTAELDTIAGNVAPYLR
ncbi:amidohydrolase family protein [Ramlibacter albus]|uniref:Amidohydrolase family protein n=1 Tax=Ramlibacter albus TaxID=2079448 RepID=A0A923S4B1_9BURK|nr:amidohydrolase family protein [Ramlibacter albus]MBC5767315.1 amidohydrolase family protein [Ramlibacter albus]